MKQTKRRKIWPPDDGSSEPLVRKAKKKKPYKIEYFSPWLEKWCHWKSYETEEQRDLAFKQLVAKSQRNSYRTLEYRIQEDETHS